MIDLHDYLMGRDAIYPQEMTDEVRSNAEETVKRVNALLALMAGKGVEIENNPKSGTPVSSGWRPPQINSQTKGAAVRSKHMTAQACDLYDPEGELDDFCMAWPDKLKEFGLWQEHPSATKGWCHVQIVPPKSGVRVFYP